MKRNLVIAAILAICSITASAASVKTSKAISLSETQMQAVKGQGILTVYWWNGNGYQVVATNSTGPFGPNLSQYTGGPLDGQSFYF